MIRTVFLLTLAILFSAAALAGEPPKEPILRIETGMHTAPIWRIGIDAGERYMVTGSQDKTVRLWSLPALLNGSLAKDPIPLAVYRVPIGPGDEGKVYAAAISPDGRQIACGGWTGDWDGSYWLYVFDRVGGGIERMLAEPSTIHSLRYSPDGRYVAAGLYSGGIRVYDVSKDYKEILSDSSYGDATFVVAFSADGRLITHCDDGYTRLYDTSFNLVARKKGSTNHLNVSFSPDGNTVAAAHADAVALDVFTGSELSTLYSADTSNLSKNGDLKSVCWSSDGRTIFAGGNYRDGNVHPVVMFPESGRGLPVSLAGAIGTIDDLAAVSDGRAVFGSFGSDFGFVGSDGRSSVTSLVIAEYVGQQSTLSLSLDGKTVGFGYQRLGNEPAMMGVSKGALQSGDFSQAGLAKPIQDSKDLRITGWLNSGEPRLGGKKLSVKQGQGSRSLAIAPDEKSFVIGLEWAVYCFDRSGAEKWSIPAPGTAWAVNVSGNGKLCVVAHGDGTIRWYRMADGKELLTFFPHADKKRWVLWTPSGYYNCSVGGEDILGWHVNNGSDKAADFFPASRFRDKYYRPDIVSRILDTLDEDEAVKLANADAGKKSETMSAQSVLDARPPVVTILSPEQGFESDKDSVSLSYSVRSPSGEAVTKVKILVDGRPVADEPGLAFSGPNGEVKKTAQVKLPGKDCKLTVIAENKYAVSEPAVVSINRKAKELTSTPDSTPTVKPNLYVVAIGVGDYASEDIPKLKYAAKDARDFLAAISRQKGTLYANIGSKLLTDAEAVKDNILDALEWLEKQTTNKDVAMLFVSGHGANDERGDYHYIPQDFEKKNWRRTGLLFTEFQLTASRVPGKMVMFVDTCDSGNVMGGATKGLDDMSKALNELMSAENGVVVFTASSGKQVSFENSKWENGAFTKALIEGIDGKADLLNKGKVTCSTLNAYIADRVKELTEGRQSPNFSLPRTVPDFPIAVVRK